MEEPHTGLHKHSWADHLIRGGGGTMLFFLQETIFWKVFKNKQFFSPQHWQLFSSSSDMPYEDLIVKQTLLSCIFENNLIFWQLLKTHYFCSKKHSLPPPRILMDHIQKSSSLLVHLQYLWLDTQTSHYLPVNWGGDLLLGSQLQGVDNPKDLTRQKGKNCYGLSHSSLQMQLHILTCVHICGDNLQSMSDPECLLEGAILHKHRGGVGSPRIFF